MRHRPIFPDVADVVMRVNRMTSIDTAFAGRRPPGFASLG